MVQMRRVGLDKTKPNEILPPMTRINIFQEQMRTWFLIRTHTMLGMPW